MFFKFDIVPNLKIVYLSEIELITIIRNIFFMVLKILILLILLLFLKNWWW